MAIRVTNSMMTSNSVRNINTNKYRLSQLETQYTTGKKIGRPSDDPIVAMRALRLRSTENQLVQYADRNLPDAKSWLEITESSLASVSSDLEEMYDALVQASNDQQAIDRQKLVDSLKAYKNKIYSEANVDNAGRTIYSGYRTDSTVTFTEADSEKRYEIKETLSASDIQDSLHILNKIDNTNLNTIKNADMPEDIKVSSIKLGYQKLENSGTDAQNNSAITSIEYKKAAEANVTTERKAGTTAGENIVAINNTDAISIVSDGDGGYNITIKDGTNTNKYTLDKAGRFIADAGNSKEISARVNRDGHLEVEFSNSAFAANSKGGLNVTAGTNQEPATKLTVTTAMNGVVVGDVEATYELAIDSYLDGSSETETDQAYKDIKAGDKDIIFLADTGEILISEKIQKELMGLSEVNGKEPITVTYRKTGFAENEVRPEQLYDCKDMTDIDPKKWQEYTYETAKIEYAVGMNQKIQINTNAKDVFNTDLSRNIDEIIRVLQQNITADKKVDEIKAKLKDSKYADDDSQTKLNSMLEAAEKEAASAKNIVQTVLGNNITKIQAHKTNVSAMQAEAGNHLAQVEVIQTRMTDQKSNVKTLRSTNEDKDIEQIVTEYKSALTAYQASLTAVGKISEISLLNYI